MGFIKTTFMAKKCNSKTHFFAKNVDKKKVKELNKIKNMNRHQEVHNKSKERRKQEVEETKYKTTGKEHAH